MSPAKNRGPSGRANLDPPARLALARYEDPEELPQYARFHRLLTFFVLHPVSVVNGGMPLVRALHRARARFIGRREGTAYQIDALLERAGIERPGDR